jgi:hypothetical protein
MTMVMDAVRTSETSAASTRLRGAASQRSVIFILAAMRTLNLTMAVEFDGETSWKITLDHRVNNIEFVTLYLYISFTVV